MYLIWHCTLHYHMSDASGRSCTCLLVKEQRKPSYGRSLSLRSFTRQESGQHGANVPSEPDQERINTLLKYPGRSMKHSSSVRQFELSVTYNIDTPKVYIPEYYMHTRNSRNNKSNGTDLHTASRRVTRKESLYHKPRPGSSKSLKQPREQASALSPTRMISLSRVISI